MANICSSTEDVPIALATSFLLLRKRKEVARAMGTSSVDEQTFALAKREQNKAEFFRKAGASGASPAGPQFASAKIPGTAATLSLPAQPSTPYPSTFPPIPTQTTTQFPLYSQTKTPTPQLLFDPNTNTYIPLPVFPTGGTPAQPQ
jgi:hypothetical protein